MDPMTMALVKHLKVRERVLAWDHTVLTGHDNGFWFGCPPFTKRVGGVPYYAVKRMCKTVHRVSLFDETKKKTFSCRTNRFYCDVSNKWWYNKRPSANPPWLLDS